MSEEGIATAVDGAGVLTPSSSRPHGERLGRYVLLGSIGEGSAGAVVAAYDTRLDRRVALKFLYQGNVDADRQRSRLRAEAQAL